MKTLYERLDDIKNTAHLSGATVASEKTVRLVRDLALAQGMQIVGYYDDPAEKLAAAEARAERLAAVLRTIRSEMQTAGFSEDGKEWEGPDRAEDVLMTVKNAVETVYWHEKLNVQRLPFDGTEAERTYGLLKAEEIGA